MNTKTTVRTLQAKKARGEKIVMLTAYDAVTARWAAEAGCDMLLVGDSMANTVLGYPTTIPLTLEESIFHTSAVRRGAPDAFVVGDMTFMSYQLDVNDAVRNAGRYLKECGADAVKLEGGREMLPVIRRMVEVGIPVVGHIGLLPQSINKDGGYRVHGRGEEEARRLTEDARALDEAGVCSFCMEGIPRELAAAITASVGVPTIGIGAGGGCDGQVQVIADLLGLAPEGGFLPRHAKNYARLNEIAVAAIRQYADEVRQGVFPSEANSFSSAK